jgi:hypothetical protein
LGHQMSGGEGRVKRAGIGEKKVVLCVVVCGWVGREREMDGIAMEAR